MSDEFRSPFSVFRDAPAVDRAFGLWTGVTMGDVKVNIPDDYGTWIMQFVPRFTIHAIGPRPLGQREPLLIELENVVCSEREAIELGWRYVYATCEHWHYPLDTDEWDVHVHLEGGN